MTAMFYLTDPTGEHHRVPARELRRAVREYRPYSDDTLKADVRLILSDLRRDYELTDDELAGKDRYWREAGRP